MIASSEEMVMTYSKAVRITIDFGVMMGSIASLEERAGIGSLVVTMLMFGSSVDSMLNLTSKLLKAL